MKNIILLVIAMLKGNGLADLSGDRTKKTRKRRISGLGSILILGFAALYMGSLSVVYVVGGHHLLKQVGLQALIMSLAIGVIAFLIFFFGLFYVMSIFYFSNDIEKLLPLPITPGQLIVSKFIVTLAYEYIITLILMAPAMIAYGILENNGFVYYVYMVIAIALIPVIPMVIASVIVMIIMRYSPSARDKDRFTLVASVLAILIGLGINFGIQSILNNTNSVDFSIILSQGASQISQISSGFFPGTYFINYALVKPFGLDSFGMMLIFILINILAASILYFAGNALYFKGVIGIGSSKSRHENLSTRDVAKSTSQGSAFVTYIKKDFKILFRTPIFFMNNVLMAFIMPAMMIVPIVMDSSYGDLQISGLREIANTTLFIGDMKTASYLLVGFFSFISFVCGANGISESAISREGNCAYLMKIIPMSYRQQIWAKISVGIILSVLSSAIILIILVVFIKPPIWFILICLSIIPGAVSFPNISGIIFDLYMPKIKWDNEQKAVKQNMNILYGILLSTLMIFTIIMVVVNARMTFGGTAIFVIFYPMLISICSSIFVNRIVNKSMLQLAA